MGRHEHDGEQNPVISHERDRLRRSAFGPDSTAQERADAEAALRRLDVEEHAAILAEREELAAAQKRIEDELSVEDELASDEGADIEGVDDGTHVQPLWLRHINVGWLVPIIVGSLLIGAGVAWGTDGQLPNFIRGAFSTSSSVFKGDLTAADTWFSTPTSPEDEDALPEFLAQSYNIDARNIRPTEFPGVWVGRTDAFLCLLIQQWEGSGATCVERADFARNGIDYAVGNLHIRWYGRDVTVSESTESGEVSVPVFPNPPTGPGNLEAANALFSAPATDKDEFPSPWILSSLEADKTAVRNIGSTDAGIKVWAVKQRDAGFCLIVSRDSSPESPYITCATVAEFRTSGLSLHALRFTARWDGESASFTG